MGSLRGEAPHNSRVGGSGGDAVPPSKINYLMSVSVRFGICFGSVGFALKPYMKPTLLLGPRCPQPEPGSKDAHGLWPKWANGQNGQNGSRAQGAQRTQLVLGLKALMVQTSYQPIGAGHKV